MHAHFFFFWEEWEINIFRVVINISLKKCLIWDSGGLDVSHQPCARYGLSIGLVSLGSASWTFFLSSFGSSSRVFQVAPEFPPRSVLPGRPTKHRHIGSLLSLLSLAACSLGHLVSAPWLIILLLIYSRAIFYKAISLFLRHAGPTRTLILIYFSGSITTTLKIAF